MSRERKWYFLYIIVIIVRKNINFMTKRTFQPKKKKRQKVHGFRQRMKKNSGKRVINKRRLKGRKRLSI